MMKYGIRKAPPPDSATRYGNLHMFPRPTQYPAVLKINSHREPHESRVIQSDCVISSEMSDYTTEWFCVLNH